MADTVLSKYNSLSAESASVTAAATAKTVLGPLDIHDIKAWTLIVANTDTAAAWTACTVDISNSTVSTAASVPAASWINAITQVAAGAVWLTPSTTLATGSANIFAFAKDLTVRWLKFTVTGNTGAGLTTAKAYFHGLRNI